MSSIRPQNSDQEPNPATMEAPAMRTSFDFVCAVSLNRHVTVRENILKTLKIIWPQSDQTESALQSILDRTDTVMREYLLDWIKESNNPMSAECFAERWDYLFWNIYEGWCHLDEESFPFDFPEYEDSHAGPPAPEYLRILESQTPNEPAAQSVADAGSSPAATPPPSPAEDGKMMQCDLGGLTERLDNSEIIQPQVNLPSMSPSSSKVIGDGNEYDLGQSLSSSASLHGPHPLPSLHTPSPRPERPVIPQSLGLFSNDQLRQRRASTSVLRDDANRQWQERQEARVEAAPEPEAAPASKPHAQDRPVVRPIREYLPQDKQDRVLSLKLRQEIWKVHFRDCALQEGAEPLQLQIPRNKRDALLLGEGMVDGERTRSVVFDRMQSYLPHAIDIIYQDAQDERFGFTLVYIGLKPAWQAHPQAYNSILALHTAWATLSPWAKLVNEGCNIDVATFAKWHTDNEIEIRRQRTSDNDTVMAEAMDFVEDYEGLSRRARWQV